jgi:GrpB-like predicted nucleotidyltransferase (UPF0157 family)
MEHAPVFIVPYDPAWPRLFEEEKARILQDIGSYVVNIEHMGSTAIPGLAAKPVIDILIGVRSLADAPLFIPPLTARGYEYVSRYEQEMPFRRYLNRKVNGEHTHHLHMVEPDTDFFRVQLAFRDYLRTHPKECEEYAALKLRLAEKYRNDRVAYTDSKNEFIQGILAKCDLK